MRHRALLALLAILFVVPACTTAGAGTLDGEARVEALQESAHAPRLFEFSSTRLGQVLVVDGLVEDDYRYRATVSLAGRKLYEEVVIDDRRWLRILATSGSADMAELPGGLSVLGDLAAASAGEWVIDAAGAPAEFADSAEPDRLLGPSTVLDAVRRLESLANDPKDVSALQRARLYDPDSANYLQSTDKFDRYAVDGDRFDILPAAYDPEAIFSEGVPVELREALEPYAMYKSYWFENQRLQRMEIFFDVDVEQVESDLRAVHEIVSGGLAGAAPPVPDVPAPFRETLTVEYLSDAPAIEAPPAATTIELPPA